MRGLERESSAAWLHLIASRRSSPALLKPPACHWQCQRNHRSHTDRKHARDQPRAPHGTAGYLSKSLGWADAQTRMYVHLAAPLRRSKHARCGHSRGSCPPLPRSGVPLVGSMSSSGWATSKAMPLPHSALGPPSGRGDGTQLPSTPCTATHFRCPFGTCTCQRAADAASMLLAAFPASAVLRRVRARTRVWRASGMPRIRSCATEVAAVLRGFFARFAPSALGLGLWRVSRPPTAV